MSETFIDGQEPPSGPQTSIAEVLEGVDRPLTDDEIVIVGRLIEAERTKDEILEYLSERVYIPTDEELETYRYEATGQGVTPIPDALPETDEDTDDADV